jgi:DNA-binding GntR family transcriptional regulator
MKPTQREIAYRHIRRKLIDGMLSSGARLSPVTLAEEIGISHTPVREAISQLESEGLVVYSAHRGAFVKNLTRRELVEVIDIRTTLECHAAAEAARRISPDQLRELDERWLDFCQIMAAIVDADNRDMAERSAAWSLADLRFHMVLFRAAGNRLALRVIEDNRIMTLMFCRRVESPGILEDRSADHEKNFQVHKDIHDAVCRRDPKAARRAMAMHMRRARKNLLDHFDGMPRPRESESRLPEDFPESARDAVLAIVRGQQPVDGTGHSSK